MSATCLTTGSLVVSKEPHPFHIAKLANEALNEVRRELMRNEPDEKKKKAIKGTRWALLHRHDNLPEKHFHILGRLRPNQPLGRGYLLKESLLDILSRTMPDPTLALKGWLGWASRCRLAAFVKLGKTIRKNIKGIEALFKERITNGLAEGFNNTIRLLSHRAYGYHSAAPLIAKIYLCCGGITLPDLQLL